MSNKVQHPFHLVDESPWPLLSALAVFFLTSGLVMFFCSGNYLLVFLSLSCLILTSFQWWKDVSSEGSLLGKHTGVVELGLRWGMLLFIISEIFFFFSFFWCYFHMSLSPSVDIGGVWSPKGVEVLDPLFMPLLNTLVLITSGVSVTWAHHSLMENNFMEAKLGLLFTCGLGVLFTLLQAMEYLETSFSVADSVYGAIFFIATGFHGLHVLVGTLFLLVTYFRMHRGQFSAIHHFGFEASAWYWHFVDVVWLFLYIFIYWWGSI